MTTLDRPATAPAPAPRSTQHVVEVIQTRWLTPHMVRVHFRADSLAELDPELHADAYVKITFSAPEGVPVRRTYTVRSFDPGQRELVIDFVVHGDAGVAGPWAATARPGDRLTVSRPGGGYTPAADIDWHLLAGDEAATPAIAAALEAMPEDAVGDAFIEVGSDADQQELNHPPGIIVHWLQRDGAEAGTSTVLADAVRLSPWRGGSVQVFVHGERGMVKQLRDYLRQVRDVPRERLSLSGYWAYGRTEDRFQAEKREPIGQISLD